GEALINLGARPESGEGMAAGDVVNTTARLQSAAPVNGVLVGETTQRATQHVIDYGELEPVGAKGKAEPIRVWEALNARSRFGVDLLRQVRSPLVGRERELALLRETLVRVREERSPQLVTLVGVPGIGKSRLVYELMQFVEQGGVLTYWRQGRSLPYGEGVTYWALSEMVKAQAGILDGDSNDDAAAKLLRAVDELVTDEREWVLRHLRPLVGLGPDDNRGAAEQSERFAAWRRFFESLAERRPAVLVFEDLHWADESLLDFIDHLAEWTARVPLLLIGTARPELLERRQAWGGGKLNATTIALSPLAEKQITELIHSLLERLSLDPADEVLVLDRAGGNPLYAEQYARMAAESGGLANGTVPENVQGIIAARLDELSPSEKALLQDASVVGKVFWSSALASLGADERDLGDHLHGLERKDLIERAHRSSVAGSVEYGFRHVLVRDVVYGQIPRSDRSAKHRRVAHWLESLGRPEDHAETVAHHYVSALELARAAGSDATDLEHRARVALVAAADRAAALNAFGQAVPHYRDALDLSANDDPQRPYLLFKLGRGLRMTDETGSDVLADALERLLALGDHETAAETAILLADLAYQRGEFATAGEHITHAAGLVRELPPSAAKASVLSQVARFYLVARAFEDAARLAAEVLVVAEPLGLDQVRASALNTRGVARVNLGDEEGIADLEASLALALSGTFVFDILRGYNSLAYVWELLGDVRRSQESSVESLRVTERLGTRVLSRTTLSDAMAGYFVLGEWDDALRLAEELIAEVEAGEPHWREDTCRRVRGEIRLARGYETGALADSERAVELARAGEAELTDQLASRAYMLLEIGAAGRASSVLDEIFRMANQMSVGGYLHHLFHIYIAYLAHALGREDEALALIEELSRTRPRTRWVDTAFDLLHGDLVAAADRCAEIGALFWEARIRQAAAEALAQGGRRTEADLQLRQALKFYRHVGATHYVRETEALLAATG
ncbi:MAG: AAA family ATPase, partial [Gaiellaceae bacterium]